MPLIRRFLPGLLLAALSAPLHRADAQVRADSIRGRVTTDSGAVIAGADVIITIAPTTNVVRQVTDSSGRYALAIPDGTGEYILYIGAVGRKPFRLRLTRTGRDSTFVVDAKLSSAVTTVATVRVAARKQRPFASLSGEGTGTSGNDKSVDGVSGALPPDLATNVDAMASLIPGLAVGPAGGNISSRNAHLTFDDPALQFSDPIAGHIGQEFSNIALNEGGTGAYALDQLFYNYGFQLARRTAAVASLTDLDAAALNLSGVSRDSASRLLQTLGALHVPASAAVAPRTVTTSASFSDRIDHRLPTIPSGSTPPPTWSLTALGFYTKSDPASLSPFATSTFGGTSTGASGTLQGAYTRYFGKDGGHLNETTSAISYSDNHGTPYLLLPAGNVLISSLLADGTTGLGALTFGGNSSLARDSKAWSWELINQTDFLANDSASRPMKLYL